MLLNELEPLITTVLNHAVIWQVAFESEVSETNELVNVKLENIAVWFPVCNLETKHDFGLLLDNQCVYVWLNIAELFLERVDPLLLRLADFLRFAIKPIHFGYFESCLQMRVLD